MVWVDSHFNLFTTATSPQPLKWPLDNGRIINDSRKSIQNPKGHQTWSVPRVVGLYFCYVSVLYTSTHDGHSLERPFSSVPKVSIVQRFDWTMLNSSTFCGSRASTYLLSLRVSRKSFRWKGTSSSEEKPHSWILFSIYAV